MWLYVLQLEGGKFYVGKTNCVEARFEAHKQGNGCQWTKEYAPIRIYEMSEIQDNGFEEDCKVKELMKNHGIDNVRGGSYTSMRISRSMVKLLTREIRHASDQCFKCGRKGHFASKCTVTLAHSVLHCHLCNNFAINCECKTIEIDIPTYKKPSRTKGKKRKTEYQLFFDKNYYVASTLVNSRNMIIINKKIAELWKCEKSKFSSL